MVTVGQHVDQGQQIAWVGSSGNSTDPHLHFAFRQNGATVETYLDPEAYWLDPLPYSGDVPGALDFGVADHFPKNDTSATDPKLRSELRYRPEDAKIFLADQANSATMWILLHGLSSDRVQFQWFRPDGSVFDTNSTSSLTIRYGWRTDSITLPSRAL